ncbi:MAG: hypothetical protein U1U88_002301 [Lawsonella clevelandensis]
MTSRGTSGFFRDDEVVLERLATICGTSRYIPDLLMNAPEVIQMFCGSRLVEASQPTLPGPRASAPPPPQPGGCNRCGTFITTAELARIACCGCSRNAGCGGSVRCALHYLGGCPQRGIVRHDVSIWRAPGSAEQDAPARIAVIGMGRLGSRGSAILPTPM